MHAFSEQVLPFGPVTGRLTARLSTHLSQWLAMDLGLISRYWNGFGDGTQSRYHFWSGRFRIAGEGVASVSWQESTALRSAHRAWSCETPSLTILIVPSVTPHVVLA